MHPKANALPDAYLLRRDVFHPAHQAEAFVAIDECNIERLALDGMHDRRGVDRSEPFTDAPFQPITASEGTKHARVKDRASRLGAELIDQRTAREMIEIGLERSVLVARHACQYPGDYSRKGFVALYQRGDQLWIFILTLARPQSCNCRRVVQDDDRYQHGACALPRRRSRTDRPAWRVGTRDVPRYNRINRVY